MGRINLKPETTLPKFAIYGNNMVLPAFLSYFTAIMQLRTLFLTCFLFWWMAAGAQTTAEKKAAKYFESALVHKSKKRYAQACADMEVSIRNNPSLPEAYSLLGQWYYEGHDFAKAAETFRKATYQCLNGKFRFVKPLTLSLLSAGAPDEALSLISNYATIKDSAEWNSYRRRALFIQSALMHKDTSEPVNLGVRVNTPFPELFPTMAVDTQFLYFTRRVNNMDEELYHAQADSCGGWFSAKNMGSPINSPNQESAQFISADGHYLFYTRCENRSENGWAEGGCDLFMAYRVALDTEWTIGQPFGRTINTTAYEGMPSLSPDNRELFFVSNREGGMGGFDIWVSKFENGLWQLPENPGPAINSPGNETTPYIAADNQTLFFASDTRPGLGGPDLFVSRRQKDGSWSNAENLGYPINTAYDERSAFVSLNGKTLYFASDRIGPAGNYDLYQVPVSPVGAPKPMSYLQGYVFDSISGERLNSASIKIRDVVTGETIYELRSNRGDASYVVTLEPGRLYEVYTDRYGYQEVSDTILFDTVYNNHPMVHNIAMLTNDYNPLVPIDDSLIATVNFEVNVTELSATDMAKLQTAISNWIEEEAIVIYVNAYTDNTGTPMINQGLSFRRASIVAAEIVASGIPETSVVARGWGEANPIADNETEEGRFKNRRVEVVVRR